MPYAIKVWFICKVIDLSAYIFLVVHIDRYTCYKTNLYTHGQLDVNILITTMHVTFPKDTSHFKC